MVLSDVYGARDMRVGICSYWFNRGQATVGRQLRDAIDSLGHETFVLARPTPDSFVLGRHVDRTDVWQQPGVTALSHHDAPAAEYLEWAVRTGCEAVLFDQNYRFEAVAELRAAGIRTIGRFVWESFAPRHVEGALEAFDVVYSLTRAEQARYEALGIVSPFVPWGCHPELLDVQAPARDDGTTRFFYPGGFLSPRKPTGAVIEAFRRAAIDGARLVVKTQRPLRRVDVRIPTQLADVDRRLTPLDRLPLGRRRRRSLGDDVDLVVADLTTSEYHRLFAGCDVCVAVSRWEGLGLHLFEATAFGMPMIGMRVPPIDEVAIDGLNAVNVASRLLGRRRDAGTPAHEPDIDSLASAFVELADTCRRADLARGARARRDALPWSATVTAIGELLEAGR